MTIEEFNEELHEKRVVLCDSAEERAEVIELLKSQGYEISVGSSRYIEDRDLSPEFLCPMLEWRSNRIVCARTSLVKRRYEESPNFAILYSDVFPLSTEPVEELVSIEEFQSALCEMSGFRV